MRKLYNHIPPKLFPEMREELDPLSERLMRLIHILDDLDVETVVRLPLNGRGAPLKDWIGCCADCTRARASCSPS